MQTHFSTDSCFLQLSLGLCATSVSAVGLAVSAVAAGVTIGGDATVLRCTAGGLGVGSAIGGGDVVFVPNGGVGFEAVSVPFGGGLTAAVCAGLDPEAGCRDEGSLAGPASVIEPEAACGPGEVAAGAMVVSPTVAMPALEFEASAADGAAADAVATTGVAAEAACDG